jgi:hypothetical protein
MTIAVMALLAVPALTLADSKDKVKSMTGEENQSLMKSKSDASGVKKPVRFQRTNYFWPFVTGPYYGDMPAHLARSPQYLKTMVGSFDTGNPITNLPGELHKDLTPLSQTGLQYFIVQFAPDAFDNGKFQNLRKEYESMGVQFFDYLPNRAYLVLLNAANHSMVASSSAVQFIEPYHPAFKISPQVGLTPLLDPVKSVSPIYTLNVMVFPNETAELVAGQISKMGGFVQKVYGDTIVVDIDRGLMGQIANLEAVRAIFEENPIVLHGEETTSCLQVGNNTGPAMSIPYFDVGIDGGGGGIAAGAQILSVIDSGISLDAGDLSHTSTVPGTAGVGHRKVKKYTSTVFAGGSGDTQSCDDITSGGYTHGHTVSSTAMGNASDVPAGYGTPWYFQDGSGNDWKIDGVAKGALLAKYDCYSTPTTGSCSEGCSAGDLYNPISPALSVLGDAYSEGARGANMSWGGNSNTYDTHPQDIDQFLFENKEAMVFVSAGNDGGDDDEDNFPDEGTVFTPATNKNGLSIGMCYNANTSSVYNPEARSFTSSVGPVGGADKPRVKPDLMAPGDDPFGAGSNMGIDSEFSCKSNDNDQTGTVVCDISQGSSGTSFASPAAMGSSAVVRDYFAQGFYPAGTSDASTIVDPISGALVKAILIASADWMDGTAQNITRTYRHNYEQGYGRIQLSHVLPLVTDPSTPIGLIIDDQGLTAGSAITPGSFAQDVFDVTDATEELRIAVAWIEAQGVDLANNLDLTVAFDADADGTIDTTEPQWWGNYFTEDWLQDDPGTVPVDLIRDGTLESKEDNDGDSTLDSSQWSQRIVDSAKAFRDDLNPNEGIFIDPGDMDDANGDGTEDDPMEGQWIWRLDADGANPDSQRYALAIAGGVALGSSIRFDKAPVLCADIVHVTVNELEDPAGQPTAAAVSTQTTLYVIDPGPDGQVDGTNDTTYDTETGIGFTQQGTTYRFLSNDIPVTDAGTQSDNNGILEIIDGYFLKAEYSDTSETKTKISIIGTDCTVKLNKGVQFVQLGRDYRYLVDGGCEVNGLGLSEPDKYMDKDEKLVYWVAILNGDIQLTDVTVTMNAYVAGTTTPSPYITVLNSPKVIGNLNANATMGIPFEIEVSSSVPTFPTEVDMVLGLKAAKSGKTVEEAETFTHLLNADDQVHHYSTDFPTGGKVIRDFNNDEVDTPDCSSDRCRQLDEPGEDWDFWYEVYNFDDMSSTAFGGGNPQHTDPWNFDSDDEGFRSGSHPDSTQGSGVIANWGEDMNYDGTLQSIEDRDDNDGDLDQNWALQSTSTMQCGYQTPYGIWRSGSSHPSPKSKTDCIGQGGSTAQKCQMYETRSGSTGADEFFEILRSPEIHKVHQTPDGTTGYDYYSEFHFMTLQWNQQVDLIDEFVLVTYEVDTDTSTDIGIKVDDFTVLGLFEGPMTIRAGGSGNQNLLDGFSVFAPSASNGNETNGSDGVNDRVGSRGCYFQGSDLNPYDPETQPHGLAKPEDDDIDNDADGTDDEYVTANGPIRNMDTVKNNGLPYWWTLEDLYGDAGVDYEVAFGFFVSEGTSSGTPTAGYGLAIDDIVLEWDEIIPIQDNTDCSVNGQCAALSVKTSSMYEGNSLVPVVVLDFDAQTTQGNAPLWTEADCDGDGTFEDLCDADTDSLYEIAVHARSEAEPEGEYFWLEQTGTGSAEYAGVIPVSAAYDTVGTIYLKREGVNLPTLDVRYDDKSDGVSTHTYGYGADGQPGDAGVDDDADGTIDEKDEHCPLGAGDILRAYDDDQCGCPNNPLEQSSSVTYPVGRMAIEQVDIIADNGDSDGYADACETVTLRIKLKNLARSGGEFIPLTGITATIQEVPDPDNDGTNDNTIACINDPASSYDDMDILASAFNDPANDFQFQVDCGIGRSSIFEELNATFDLNVSAAEIDGLYQPLRIVLPLDLDHTGGGSVLAEEYENFDGGSHKFEFIRVAHTDGIRCQYNDPDNPDGFSYQRANCAIDSFPGYTDQDWHLHDTTMPDSGRSYNGANSIHFGYHANPSDAGGDTLHFQEMNLARVTAANRINLGLDNPILSFKQQLNLLDSRWSNTPGGEAADRAIVMIAKTNNAGTVQCEPSESDRCWYKIFPYENVYNVQGTDQFTNCTFDPIDDGSNEDDFFPNTHFWGPSSMCFPEFVWSWMGDTDHQAVCDPENGIGAGNGPGLCGASGPGTWVETKFNLYPFRGYQVRFRFIATTIEVFPAQTYQQSGWPVNMDGDDGWYVDDIRITDTLSTPVTLSVDAATNPTATCPTDPNQNCDTITPDITCTPDGIDNDQDGSVDEVGENNCQTLAPGHAFTLTAAASSANKCVDGSLNYRFWLDSDADGTISDEPASSILYEWSDKNVYVDNPVSEQQYCAEIRCATDTGCVDHTCVAAGPAPAGPAVGVVTGYKFSDDQKTIMEWTVDINATSYDIVKGDLDLLRTNSGDFSASSPSCHENDSVDTQTSDATNPTGNGQGFYYLARASNAQGNGTYDTAGSEGRDTDLGSTCP